MYHPNHKKLKHLYRSFMYSTRNPDASNAHSNDYEIRYYGNRAACFVQKRQFEDALRDCDRSLKFNPTYVKVMMRRSKANECLDKLEDALEDAKSALKAAPSFVKAATEVRRLEIAVKKKHEKMKEEVFGKLKDLGNSILGNFGMSMDNFKAVQDPTTGSYSISYQS